MKHWLHHLLITSTLCTAAIHADGDDPFAPGKDPAGKPGHVRVQIKLIETSSPELNKIINLPIPAQQNLYTPIQKLMQEGKARLIHEVLIIARSGKKAVVESIREMIYPTEYEPPGSFPLTTTPSNSSLLSTVPSLRPSYYTAFETRNTGDVLEIELALSDDRKYIDLRISHERIFHKRDITWVTHKDRWGNANVFFPEFDTYRTNTAITLRNKQPRFISTFTPKTKDGKLDTSKKVLMFVKATVITP